jgi:voltage-gated potassium channel
VVRSIVSVVTLAGLAIGIIWQLRRHLDDSSKRVDGLIVSIVLVIFVFSHAFYVLQRNDPAQFVGLHTRLDSLYFAITTLTTVGTGDIHAAGQVGRALVLVQMIFNVVFVATTASLLSTRVRESVANKTQERRTRKPR